MSSLYNQCLTGKACKSLLTLFLSLVLTPNIYSQNLLNSRQSSVYTYIYKISNKEAETIYKNSISIVDERYFHTLYDSCLTDRYGYTEREPGHYLLTYASKNRQDIRLVSVSNLNMFILNNYTDLCLQFYTNEGNIINDAKAEINRKRLKYEERTNLYVDKHSCRKGIIKVNWQGVTSYFSIDREYDISGFALRTQRIFYRTPLRYISLPIRYTVGLPYDGIRSIANRTSVGTIYMYGLWFRKIRDKAKCLLSEERCRSNNYSNSYMVFNKPKYKPGDTLKFKAFIINKRGRPLNSKVQVSLSTNDSDIKLSDLQPYSAGGYEYQFCLHDSLKLKLDRDYSISLKNNKFDNYVQNSFSYEDYELNKTSLVIRSERENHYNSQNLKLFIKATDENNLTLQDGRVEILVKADKVEKCFSVQTLIPDTLLYIEKILEPVGETELLISDSTFPKANFSYTIMVRLLTSDNEAITRNQAINYFNLIEQFEFNLQNDSLEFCLLKNGLPLNDSIIVSGVTENDNESVVYTGIGRGKIKINPMFNSYYAESENTLDSYSLEDKLPLVQCYSQRTLDSLIIVIDNPRQIPVTYELFKRNKREEKGFVDNLNFHKRVDSKKNYYIALRYLWSGEVRKEFYRIPLRDKLLNIDIKQPEIIFPGQKSNIEIHVTDQKGKPVEGVDLTAYSITKKFNHSPAEIPYIGKQRKEKYRNIDFIKSEFEDTDYYRQLNFESWKILASLDSIEYYKFIYPGNSIYRFECQTNDSITQFAPYVFYNGYSQQAHIIYLDKKPVYFSWTTSKPPYSFRADSGYHQITLRTSNRVITIDSIYMSKGKKLIFSLDHNVNLKNIKIETALPELSDAEKSTLFHYIIPYKNTFRAENQLAYLEQDNDLQILDGNLITNFAGPFNGYLNFNIVDGYSIPFKHESMFEYEFDKGLIKMKCINSNNFPSKLNNTGYTEKLTDSVLTRDGIKNICQKKLESKRSYTSRFPNPTYTQRGYGNIKVEYTGNFRDNVPLNLLLFKYEDKTYIRVYPGNEKTIHNLDPGKYRLVIFCTGSYYHAEDSILLKSNTSTYLTINVPKVLRKDDFSLEASKLISDVIYSPFKRTKDPERELNAINNLYYQGKEFSGSGTAISGHVYDLITNEPIPFVQVLISNTEYGTLTDINGFYSINVPSECEKLMFSFIGYDPLYKKITDNDFDIIKLEPSELELEGVVVTCYSIPKIAISRTSCGVSFGGIKNSNLIKNNTKSNEPNTNIINGKSPLENLDNNEFYENAKNSGGVRSHFSDYAFWQPKLITNNEGKASFDVTFPDDVTSWQTHYVAMNDKKQSGQTSLSIRSFKPLIAQLSVPRFLIEGDTAFLIGKSSNYMNDTALISTSFKINGTITTSKSSACIHAITDSLMISPTDTISIGYTLTKADGYIDGETRKIAVYPIGLEESYGKFYSLDGDTSLICGFNQKLGEVKLYAKADFLDVIKDDLNHLIHYKYACNEQLASKLIALLSLSQIEKLEGDETIKEKAIRNIISQLIKNQNDQGLWGWWKNSEQSDWITLHVVEALTSAATLGFKVPLNNGNLIKHLMLYFDNTDDFFQKARILKTMLILDPKMNLASYIKSLEKNEDTSFAWALEILDVRRRCGLEYDINSILPYQRRTLYGNIYFSDKESETNLLYKDALLQNETQKTLLVYNLLKSDSLQYNQTLLKIRNYFLEIRNSRFRCNTYESAKIIETILPDLLKTYSNKNKPVMIFSGAYTDTITEFPFEKVISQYDTLKVSKSGNYPVYFTSWQQAWNPKPNYKKEKMEINTWFAGNTGYYLKAGQETTLIAEVTLQENAEYVMINIPIPGSCSYSDKKKKGMYESHREYYKNETTIFCHRLSKGTYQFEVKLLPRYSGSYTLNPAKIELMYFPVINANNEVKKVKVVTRSPVI